VDRGLTHARLAVGRDLLVITEQDDGVEVEGRARLRPGRDVELVYGPVPGALPLMRRACVHTWRVVRVGRDGVLFRGFCRWV
jgi:hypothetical protein